MRDEGWVKRRPYAASMLNTLSLDMLLDMTGTSRSIYLSVLYTNLFTLFAPATHSHSYHPHTLYPHQSNSFTAHAVIIDILLQHYLYFAYTLNIFPICRIGPNFLILILHRLVQIPDSTPCTYCGKLFLQYVSFYPASFHFHLNFYIAGFSIHNHSYRCIALLFFSTVDKLLLNNYRILLFYFVPFNCQEFI